MFLEAALPQKLGCKTSKLLFMKTFLTLQNSIILALLLQAFVAIGDYNGHVGLGVKCSKEVATAIRGAIILAKLSIVPVRRGYWGNKIGKPHTVPCKVSVPLACPRALLGAELQGSPRGCAPGLTRCVPAGHRALRLRAGAPDPGSPRHRHRVCPCPQEAADDGWHR